MSALKKLQEAVLHTAMVNDRANEKMSSTAKAAVVAAFVATLAAGHQQAYAQWDQADKCAAAGAVVGGAVGYGATKGDWQKTAVGAIAALAGEATGRALCSSQPEKPSNNQQNWNNQSNWSNQPVNDNTDRPFYEVRPQARQQTYGSYSDGGDAPRQAYQQRQTHQPKGRVGQNESRSVDWENVADIDETSREALAAYVKYRDGLMKGRPNSQDLRGFNSAADTFWQKADFAYRTSGNKGPYTKYVETATAVASIQDSIARGEVRSYSDLVSVENRERASAQSFAVELVNANKRARQNRF